MNYRIKIRNYAAFGCRPFEWQSSGMYDIGAATLIVDRIRAQIGDDHLGCDVWLVPL